MMSKFHWSFVVLVLLSSSTVPVVLGADSPDESKHIEVMKSSTELAHWIDAHFAKAWKQSEISPPDIVDDATFLKRAYLDLSGSVPAVSEAREFLAYQGAYKRDTLIDQLLNLEKRNTHFNT